MGGARVRLEPIFWEHEPLRASGSFQDEIPLPSQADVVLCILWSRLGTRLPKHLTRDDGSTFASGTEFEFEDALNSFHRQGKPDLLVYRKTAQPVAELSSEKKVLQQLEQKKALDAFVEKQFQDVEGALIAAFHAFAGPAIFEELLEEHLRRLIEVKVSVADSGQDQIRPLWTKGSPYRGLESFAYEHAAVFCGRTAEVGQMLDALRRQAAAGKPFLLVLGMSGCGKSSLVRAGLLPELTYPNVIEGIGLWRRAELLPGRAAGDLMEGLAAALLAETALPELARQGTSAHELSLLLRDRPEAVAPLLRSGLSQAAQEVQQAEGLAREPIARVALVVDQLEELFTIERITPEERKRFDAAISALVTSGLVWTVATLRSDFYGQCTALTEIMALKEGAGQFDLRPPDSRAIGQVIRQPARIAGLTFEEDPETGERLDDLLRDAAIADPSALPLLEFTLEELYQRRREDGRMTLAAYHELGGVEGALAHRAEEVYQRLSPAAREALPKILPALVAGGLAAEAGEIPTLTRRRAPMASVAAIPGARELIDCFVAQRLLTSDVGADGTPVVTVTHEALLGCWPRVRDLLREQAAMLQTCAELKAAAVLWHRGGEGEDFLLPEGRLLADAGALVDSGDVPLDELETRLVAASRQALEKRRLGARRRRWLLGAAAALILTVVTLLMDFFVWSDVGYYGMLTKRYGQPQGIGELSKSEVRKRQWSIKLIRRGRLGPVTRLEVVNGRGHLTPYHPVGQYLKGYEEDLERIADRECALTTTYDDAGRIAYEKAENCFGSTVWELDYLISAESEDANKIVGTFVEDGRPSPQAASGAARVVIFHDELGREIGSRYQGVAGEPRASAEGIFGMDLELDARGLPRKVVYVGPEGGPARSPEGCLQVQRDYDDEGRELSSTCLGDDGRPVMTRHGFARLETTYDAVGNPTEIALLNEDGDPIPEIARIQLAYSSRGDLVEQRFLTADDRPATAYQGNIAVRREVDERGLVVAETLLDQDESPMIGQSRFATRRFDFDPRTGALRTIEYFGQQGEKVRDAQGKAIHRYELDDRGQVIEERFEDEAGNLTPTTEGYARIKRVYSTEGMPTEAAYFDSEGRPACTQQGYARLQMEYDARGNLVRETFLDDAGEPVPGAGGFSGIRRVFGAGGQVLGERYLDRSGQLTAGTEGYARQTREYDERGNPLRIEYYRDDGDMIRQDLWEYDERGFSTGVAYLDGAGGPLEVDGIAKQRWRNNARDDPLETTFYDAEGEPETSGGYAGVRSEYDFFGNEIEEIYLDGDRNPTANDQGIGVIVWRYDSRQRPLEQRYLDTFRDPVIHPDLGYAVQKWEYDERGNPYRESYLDEREYPLAHIEKEFDQFGRPIELRYLDAQEKPREDESGCSTVRLAYDHLANPIEMECFGPAGRPEVSAYGFIRLRIRRNGCGEALEAALYDADGRVSRRLGVRGDFDPLRAESWRQTTVSRRTETPPPPPPATIRSASATRSTSPPPPSAPTRPRETADPIPAGGDIDAVTGALERLGEQVHHEFDDFDDDPKGDAERLHDLLEQFEDATGDLRSSYRRGSGRGLGGRLGLRRKLSEQEAYDRLRGDLRRLQGLSRQIGQLGTRNSLGPAAYETWRRTLGQLQRLAALLR